MRLEIRFGSKFKIPTSVETTPPVKSSCCTTILHVINGYKSVIFQARWNILKNPLDLSDTSIW